VRCGSNGGGVGARAVVEHRAKQARERGEGWAGDADATVHDKLKRSNWDGHKMDKI
jgi:hypothetical protein